MIVPPSIKNSTEINNGEVQITVEQFIVNNFINSNDGKDRLHSDRICGILNENGYKCSVVEAMPAVAERLRRAYPAPLGRAGVGSIPANPRRTKRAFFPPLAI